MEYGDEDLAEKFGREAEKSSEIVHTCQVRCERGRRAVHRPWRSTMTSPSHADRRGFVPLAHAKPPVPFTAADDYAAAVSGLSTAALLLSVPASGVNALVAE